MWIGGPDASTDSADCASRPNPEATERDGRVPAVYLKLAFLLFLAFLPLRRISKLRVSNTGTGFESLPLRQKLISLL